MNTYQHGKTRFHCDADESGDVIIAEDALVTSGRAAIPFADLKAFVLGRLSERTPSRLPVEQMARDAREGLGFRVGAVTLAQYVLALLAENAELRGRVGAREADQREAP